MSQENVEIVRRVILKRWTGRLPTRLDLIDADIEIDGPP